MTLNTTDPGKVQGEKLNELFQLLIDKKVIMTLRLIGSGFERLTFITGLREEANQPCLLVDLPKAFKQAARRVKKTDIQFNFNGPDHLEYIFNTSGGSYSGNDLVVPFPEYVERIQRRRNFRMDCPVGSRMQLKHQKLQGLIYLINISMGGAYGVLVKHNAQGADSAIFQTGQRLYKTVLIFPSDNDAEEQVIHIRKMEVRRVEQDKERKLYKYAFEFVDIERDEKQKLTQSIYHLQRQFLKRR